MTATGLTVKTPAFSSADYREIANLPETQFSANERMAIGWLKLLALRGNTKCRTFYDGGTFCGFGYTVADAEQVFVLYPAVNGQIQSKG